MSALKFLGDVSLVCSFLLLTSTLFSGYGIPILCIHTPVDGHCFKLWASTNNATMNIHMRVCVWTLFLIPRDRIAGFYHNFMFNCLGLYQTFPEWVHHFIVPQTMYYI